MARKLRKKQTGGSKTTETVMTEQMKDFLKRQGLTDKEIQAFVIKENQKNVAKKEQTYTYDGITYTASELKAIKKRKEKKKKKMMGGGMKKMYKKGGFLEPNTPNLDDL